MAKKTVSEVLERRSRRLRWIIAALFAGLIALQAGAFTLVLGLMWDESVASWLPELLIASTFLLAGGVLTLIVIIWQQGETAGWIRLAADREKQSLNLARNEANELKALAAAIGSSRDLDGLFDITLNSYQAALNDYGVVTDDQLNAIFLLDDGHLSAATARGRAGPEEGARLDRWQGIVDLALAQAELQVSDRPDQDPALSRLSWLQDRRQVICVPLCTAHGLYGLIVLAMKDALAMSVDEMSLLQAIADQVALALHNFQVHQNLEQTRIAYLTAEDDERRRVRQALHDGPSRLVAAVALRLGLIRTMMIRDPGQAAQELRKLEVLTRQSSEELRDMVSYLRPLDLGVNDLDRAVNMTLHRIEEGLGLELRVGRRATDKRLDQQARAVILYVLEGSLAWARNRGQATAAEINLWQEEDRFYLSIEDDGYAQAQGKRQAIFRDNDLGTILMRAKVERVGGRLDSTPKPGRGVVTVMVLPLGPPGQPPEP